MSFAFFTNLVSRAKSSGSTTNIIKDSLAKPSAHSRTNSGTVDVLLSSPIRREPRTKRNVKSQAQWRHAGYFHPSIALADSSMSTPNAPSPVCLSPDAEDMMGGINGLILKKYKKQFPEDGQIRVAPAHGSLVAIIRCGGPEGWSIEIKDPSELPKPTKQNVALPHKPSPSPTPALSQEQLEVIEGLNRMLVKKYKKTLPENGEMIMVPAHGAVMARLRCGGPDGWAAQINPDLAPQVV